MNISSKVFYEEFPHFKFLTVTQNEIERKENVEKKHRVFRRNNTNLRKLRGFLGSTSGGEPACHCWRCKRCRFTPWVGKILWRRAWQPTPVFLPGEFYGQRSLVSYGSWGRKKLDVSEVT